MATKPDADWTSVRISIPSDTPRAGSSDLENLKSELSYSLPQSLIKEPLKIKKPNHDTLDIGTVIVMSLGAPAVIILAKAIRDWVKRTGTSTIKINDIEISNVESKDISKILEAIDNKA